VQLLVEASSTFFCRSVRMSSYCALLGRGSPLALAFARGGGGLNGLLPFGAAAAASALAAEAAPAETAMRPLPVKISEVAPDLTSYASRSSSVGKSRNQIRTTSLLMSSSPSSPSMRSSTDEPSERFSFSDTKADKDMRFQTAPLFRLEMRQRVTRTSPPTGSRLAPSAPRKAFVVILSPGTNLIFRTASSSTGALAAPDGRRRSSRPPRSRLRLRLLLRPRLWL